MSGGKPTAEDVLLDLAVIMTPSITNNNAYEAHLNTLS